MQTQAFCTYGSGRRLAVAGVSILLLWLSAALPPCAQAQHPPGTVGIGLHVGRPGGVLAKWHRPGNRAYVASFTTDLDDRALLRLFRVRERLLTDGSPLHRFWGPGVELGMLPHNGERAPAAGVGLVAGINFYAERFEVVVRTMPYVRLLPKRDLRLGGSVGLRYSL
jgi:hypothetical protein